MRRWSLDLRSLALLRICYGFVLITDVLVRLWDLRAHYTDWGAVPRSAVLEFFWNPAYWSLHMISGHWAFQGALLLLQGLAGCALAVGYRTRLATVLGWVLLVSLHNRNPMVLDGGDNYMRLVMFWAMFLPWGARWSLDRRLAPANDETDGDADSGNSWFDLAGVAYMAQISLVYVFAGLLKSDPVWTHEGSATYYALMIDQLATPLAPYMLAHPPVMKFLTFAVLYFEIFGPILLWLTPWLRLLGVVGITALHLGFASFLHLAVFAMVGTVSSWGMIPGFVWDTLERKAFWQRLCRWVEGVADRLHVPPSREDSRARPHAQHVRHALGILLIYCIAWNFTTLPNTRLDLGAAANLGHFLRIDQRWNMFAPKPLVEDGWYVIEADQLNGHKIDLYRNGAELDWRKPSHVASTYPNARWRKLMMNLWGRDCQSWRLPYGRYLTRLWNESHQGQEQISGFRIYFMLEATRPDGTQAPVEKTLVWTHRCFDNPAPGSTLLASPTAHSKPH